jgi:hypothetical protein
MGNCISKRRQEKEDYQKTGLTNAIIITNTKYDSYNIPENLQGFGYTISELKNNTEPLRHLNITSGIL